MSSAETGIGAPSPQLEGVAAGRGLPGSATRSGEVRLWGDSGTSKPLDGKIGPFWDRAAGIILRKLHKKAKPPMESRRRCGG